MVLPRRLRSPLPDRQCWRDIKARLLQPGDVVASQVGGVDSVAVLGDRVLVENWTGHMFVFALEDTVTALVMLGG